MCGMRVYIPLLSRLAFTPILIPLPSAFVVPPPSPPPSLLPSLPPSPPPLPRKTYPTPISWFSHTRRSTMEEFLGGKGREGGKNERMSAKLISKKKGRKGGRKGGKKETRMSGG